MRSIEDIIREKIKEKYRKKLNATKALNRNNNALKGLFMDIIKKENSNLTDEEIKIVNEILGEFIKEEEFSV